MTGAAAPENLRGALWILGSAACFTVMAACLKLLAQGGYSESQMIFCRCAAGLVVLAPIALRSGGGVWRLARPRLVLMRCALSTLGFFAGFYAFANLPLAQAQAISFSRSLFVAVLAVWILKERVAWRRWLAIGVGFAGVLLMVRPDAGASLTPAVAAALVSAFLFAWTLVTVKDLSRDHTTLQLVVFTNAFTTLAGLPLAFFAWTTPGLGDAGLFALLGLAGVGAQSCYVRGVALGEASLMGLVDYVRLPLAALAGFIVFAERPDSMTLLGAGVVIAATGYITWREARVGAKTRAATPTDP